MGCVFGKEAPSRKPVERRWEREGEREDRSAEEEVSAAKAEVAAADGRNGGGDDRRRKEGREEGNVRPRRRSTRPRNIPKHVHGEQVAAGWPSWLSEVAGEAISGWTPRRADSFEKIDKVMFHSTRSECVRAS